MGKILAMKVFAGSSFRPWNNRIVLQAESNTLADHQALATVMDAIAATE
jgi:hypothetical protein